jgi:hypothetical protein
MLQGDNHVFSLSLYFRDQNDSFPLGGRFRAAVSFYLDSILVGTRNALLTFTRVQTPASGRCHRASAALICNRGTRMNPDHVIAFQTCLW